MILATFIVKLGSLSPVKTATCRFDCLYYKMLKNPLLIVLCIWNVPTVVSSTSPFKCPLMLFLHNDSCVSECPGSLIGDVANRICSEKAEFKDPKSRFLDGMQNIVLATNATEYKAVILSSTKPDTRILTFGVKDSTRLARTRRWGYRLESCDISTAVFPYRVQSRQLKVKGNVLLQPGTYSRCIVINAIGANPPLVLYNTITVTIVRRFVMITDHPQSELATVGGSLEFSCGYVLYADNPYLFAPHWYLDGRRLANNSVVNGTLVNITCDSANSTIRLDSLSVSLDGQTLQCRLESDFLDVPEESNNATIMFSPTDPVLSPLKLETHETAKFTCTHTRGFPVYWNISSQVPINPMHENGTEVSTLTIESVSPGMNLTEIQCWQKVFDNVVSSETATLIVSGPPSEVSNLTLVSVTTSTITLSWDEPFAFESAPVLGYHIQYSSGTCRPNSNSPLVSANELSFTLQGLRDGTNYCIVVSALSIAGQGGTTRIWASTEDINECANPSTHNCSQECRNTIGSYKCACPRGYQLGEDGFSCKDVDECQRGTHNCSDVCVNTIGGYNCSCSDGHQLLGDGLSCQDINECANPSTHNCAQECRNTIGSHVCLCFKGYQLGEDGFGCKDVDECAMNTHKCDQICHNTNGSYDCSCEEDYKQEGSSCLFIASPQSLKSLKIPSNASVEEKLKASVKAARALKDFQINASTSEELSDTVKAVVDVVDSIISARNASRRSSVTLSPEEEEELNQNTVGILGQLLSPDMVDSLTNGTDTSDTSTNKSSPLVQAVGTVERLGVLVASSENTRSNATYKRDNLKMVVVRNTTGPRYSVGFKGLSVSVGAQKKTAFVATSYGRLDAAFPVKSMMGEVDSGVISLQLVDKKGGKTVQPKTSDDPFPVRIAFMDVMYTENSSCGYYVQGNKDGGVWSTEGLETVNCSHSVCCRSSHLTNFAVLVNVGNVQHDPAIETALIVLSYIGCGLSIICLVITIIALSVFRYKGQKTPLNFVHINLSVVLLVALVLFVGTSYTLRHYPIPCAIVTGLLHYLFLAVFTWMLCEGIMLYLMLVKVFSSLPKKLWFFLILGYGIPVIPVVVTAGVKHKTYGNNTNGCWLSSDISHGTIWGFAAPVVAIMIINAVFLILAVVQLCKSLKVSSVRETSNKRVALSTLRATVLLLPLLGLTWVFGFITFDIQSENIKGLEVIPLIFQIIFILLNSTQGVFIFIFYVLRNEKVVPLWRRCCIKCCPSLKSRFDGSSSKSRTDTVQLGTFGGTSTAGKDELTKAAEPDVLVKDADSITETTLHLNNHQNGTKDAVYVSEHQEVSCVFSDADSLSSAPNMEFALGEPVISSTVGVSRTSPM